MSDYGSRLRALGLLPLMYTLELNDIMFCVRSIKNPSRAFNIMDFIRFTDQGTRSSSASKMSHTFHGHNVGRHVYFNRIQRLWNALPLINLDHSLHTIKKSLTQFLYAHFLANFNPNSSCTYHYLCPCRSCSFNPHPPNFLTLPLAASQTIDTLS